MAQTDDQTSGKKQNTRRAQKAYKNLTFLNSSHARSLRILSEYVEPEHRFEEAGLKHTVVFFGSARTRTEARENTLDNGQFYKAAEEFAFQLAQWSKELQQDDSFLICSGGGPGIMQAANQGAHRAGKESIGLNISLPFEQGANPFVSERFNFEFHYFFMRKLWFLYHAKALVVFPGGFGTMDELFETLTLMQTHKLHKGMPVMLYDRKFWQGLIDFKQMVSYGLISADDLNLFHYFDSPEEGMAYLKPRLLETIAAFTSESS